jgi:hypothetical protein
MTNNRFGLAQIKTEGADIAYGPGDDSPSKSGPSKSRWIELRYDPDDEVNESVVEELASIIDGISEPERDAILKRLCHLYIDDRGL